GLEARWDRLETQCDDVPSTLVHGDFRPKNAYVRAGEDGIRLFPIDWEMAGWGVPAADLTRVDLAAYQSVASEFWPELDSAAVHRLAGVGQVFRYLAGIAWECSTLVYPSAEVLCRPLASLRVLNEKLAVATRNALHDA